MLTIETRVEDELRVSAAVNRAHIRALKPRLRRKNVCLFSPISLFPFTPWRRGRLGGKGGEEEEEERRLVVLVVGFGEKRGRDYGSDEDFDGFVGWVYA